MDYSFLIDFFISPQNLALCVFSFALGFSIGLKFPNNNKRFFNYCPYETTLKVNLTYKERTRKIIYNDCKYLEKCKTCSKYNLECPFKKGNFT